ncbi:MAG: class I SAM-dependent methyltransferase [Proteobacteria bacterium]|nr:class I SAM-dependent methyltransferase [Pseudomonadota bacterium]MDA1132000.1 class I SAM-dependent methyltransferase [Pseudomonadota bacterium]
MSADRRPNFFATAPDLAALLDGVIASMPFPPASPLRVLDLGPGRGDLCERLLQTYPNATATLLEPDTGWYEISRQRLRAFADRVALRGDDFRFGNLPREQDLVVSAFCLSSVNDIDRRGVYRAIYNALNPDGLCRVLDRVRGPTETLESLYAAAWEGDAIRAGVPSETLQQAQQAYARTKGFWIGNEITWLDSIGFRDVDIFHKIGGFAVIGCRKPATADFDRIRRARAAADSASGDERA